MIFSVAGSAAAGVSLAQWAAALAWSRSFCFCPLALALWGGAGGGPQAFQAGNSAAGLPVHLKS